METKDKHSILAFITEVLQQMNCSFEPFEENIYHVVYKDVDFMINESEQNILHIFDGFWKEYPLDENPDVMLIFSTINACNDNGICRVIYSIEDEKNVMAIHTYCTLACIPSTTNDTPTAEAVAFVSHIFDSVLEVREKFQTILEEGLRGQSFLSPSVH